MKNPKGADTSRAHRGWKVRAWLQRLRTSVAEHPEKALIPLVFITVVVSWELIVRLFHIRQILLPAPSAIVRALVEQIVKGYMLRHLLVTMYENLAGYLIGSGLGLLIGILVAQFPLVEKTLFPYVVAFETLPKVAIAPIVIIWLGFGYNSKIAITAMIVFFPVVVNTMTGLRATDPQYLEMLTAFTATKWQAFRIVKVPMALPYIFAGLDIASVLGVIGAIVAEFVGARAGLGYLILHRMFMMDMPTVFATLIVLSLMGYLMHMAVVAIRRKVVFWTEEQAEVVASA
jgi:NitT/TauT family transport system permease protein